MFNIHVLQLYACAYVSYICFTSIYIYIYIYICIFFICVGHCYPHLRILKALQKNQKIILQQTLRYIYVISTLDLKTLHVIFKRMEKTCKYLQYTWNKLKKYFRKR